MAKCSGGQAFINVKHEIKQFLIVAMEGGRNSLTFYNKGDGEGKECLIPDDIHADVKKHFEEMYLNWDESENVITITWE